MEDIKGDLKKIWTEGFQDDSKIHITMNLPALAIEFLKYFRGLLSDFEELKETSQKIYPLIHVYMFIKGESLSEPDEAMKAVKIQTEKHFGRSITSLEGIYFVRNVAPNKDMYRLSFYLNDDILFEQMKRKRKSSTDDNSEVEIKLKC